MTTEELFALARAGDTSIITYPGIMEIFDEMGNTPIHILAVKGYIEALTLYDYNNNVKNNNGLSILHSLGIGERTEILTVPELCLDLDIYENTGMHYLASYGKKEVLTHSQVATAKNNSLYTPLHNLAPYLNENDILTIPEVSTVKTISGDTPLHHMSYMRRIFVLNHPDVASVTNNNGDTPLHGLSRLGVYQVLDNPQAFIVTNNEGRTPASYLGY